mgnify:FL=1
MKTNVFSNETLNAAVKAMSESQEEIKNLREQAKVEPINEVVQRYLMDKLDMTQSEAEEVCNDIQQGITEFDSQFAANSASEKAILREKLESVIKDMEEETRVKYLSGILTAFQVAQQQELSAEEVTSLQESNAKLSVEDLISKIETQFNDNFSVENLAEFVNTNVDASAIIELAHQIDMSKEEYRFLAAAILCVGQHTGKVKLSEEPIPASLLGALASAGVETLSLTGELKEGKIDLKRWQTVLKWILGALVVCALGVAAIVLVSLFTASLVDVIFTLLGDSFLGMFVTSIISVFVAWNTSEYLLGNLPKLLDLLASVYDQYIEPITQKVKNWAAIVKGWIDTVVDKVKVGSTVKTVEPVETPPTVAQPNPVLA